MREKRSNQHQARGAGHALHKISNLERQEIQAPLITCMLEAFIHEIGYERAMEVASIAIKRDAMRAGKAMAGEYGGNGLKELLRVVSEIWAEDNALEFEIVEESERILSFIVTRCRYAEMYDRIGLKQYGLCLSCNRDKALIKGFNPHLKLNRTQTIMQDGVMCNFRISVDKK